MRDPNIFGREIAALAMNRLRAVGLSSDPAVEKRQQVRRVSGDAMRAIEIAGGTLLGDGHELHKVQQWILDAKSAFNLGIVEGRQAIAMKAAPAIEDRH